MDRAWKFFGSSISYTVLNLPLTILYQSSFPIFLYYFPPLLRILFIALTHTTIHSASSQNPGLCSERMFLTNLLSLWTTVDANKNVHLPGSAFSWLFAQENYNLA